MPAGNPSSEDGDEPNSEANGRTYWRDYHPKNQGDDDGDTSGTWRLLAPADQSTALSHFGSEEVLKDEERKIINHAPGRSERNQSTRLAHLDKINITGRYCEELDLPNHWKLEAQRLMAELNLDRFGNQKRIEKIALVVIRYVADQARLHRPSDYPDRISTRRQYKRLLKENDMDLGDVMRLSGKLKQILRELEDSSSNEA